MFVHVSNNAKTQKKVSILMGFLFVLTGSFGALFSMHVYVKRRAPVPPGFRVFGFPRPRRDS